MLGLWVLELFTMYETTYATNGDRQTDGRTDKGNADCSFPDGWGIIMTKEHKTNW